MIEIGNEQEVQAQPKQGAQAARDAENKQMKKSLAEIFLPVATLITGGLIVFFALTMMSDPARDVLDTLPWYQAYAKVLVAGIGIAMIAVTFSLLPENRRAARERKAARARKKANR